MWPAPDILENKRLFLLWLLNLRNAGKYLSRPTDSRLLSGAAIDFFVISVDLNLGH